MAARRLLPQFGLRSFLIAWVTVSCGVAWVSHVYYRYQVEQGVLERLRTTARLGSLATIARVDDKPKASVPVSYVF